MKKLGVLFVFAISTFAVAQTENELKNIQEQTGLSYEDIHKIYLKKEFVQNVGEELLVLDSIRIKKGDYIQIHLPTYGKDFYFVEQKKGFISATNILGATADAVSIGAIAVGLGSNNLGTMSKSLEVFQKAKSVSYGADALDRVDKLPISKKSKRIAGKKMEVVGWEKENGAHIITAKLDNKRYEIELENAYLLGEIKL